MRGIQIGEHHTGDDWGLLLNSKSVSPPAPKVVTVAVDGRDGDLDLSEALTGEMRYSNREASFGFILTEGTQIERETLIGEIINAVHGLRKNIILPDDPDHYLVGRCNVSEVKNDRAYGTLRITATCEPYRYSVLETVRTITATTTAKEVVLTNSGRKTVVPSITVTGSVSVTFGDSAVTLSTGTYKIASLTLKSGPTILKVSGSGTIVFTYREGVL